MEMGESEKVANGDSGDDYTEMEVPARREDFTFKLLFVPSGDVPTQMSGTIVYITTAVICEFVVTVQGEKATAHRRTELRI